MNFEIPALDKEVEVEVKEGIFVKLQELINVVIAFINDLIKFAF